MAMTITLSYTSVHQICQAMRTKNGIFKTTTASSRLIQNKQLNPF